MSKPLGSTQPHLSPILFAVIVPEETKLSWQEASIQLPLTLGQCRQLWGHIIPVGHFEARTIRLPGLAYCEMIWHDEGLLRGMEKNPLASQLAGFPVVGTVILSNRRAFGS